MDAAFTLRNSIWFLLAAVVTAIISRGVNKKTMQSNCISLQTLFLICFGLYALMVTLLLGDTAGITKLIYQISWVVIVVAAYPNNVQEQIKLLNWMKIFLICLCVLGIYEYYAGIDFWSVIGMTRNSFGYASSFNRITSLFYNSLIYSMYLELALILEIQFPFKNVLGHIATLLLVVLNLAFTFCRSAWVITLLAVLLYYIVIANKRIIISKNGFFVGLCTVAVIAVAFYYNRELIAELNALVIKRFSMFGKTDYSYTQRFGAIKNVATYLLTHPLQFLVGAGRGYAQKFMQEHGVYQGFDAVDNQYFSLLLEFGLIGTSLFVTVMALNLKTVVSHIKNSTADVPILKATFMMLCCFLMDIFFYDGMSWYTVIFVFALIICMSKAQRKPTVGK